MTLSELCDSLMTCYESQAPPTPSPLSTTRPLSTEIPAVASEEELLTRRKRLLANYNLVSTGYII